jgi:hypothetical protein
MQNAGKKVACVDQESSARPLTLVGDISPAVMRDFEDCCVSYFENKDIADNKQVHKILAGIKDTCVRDWITSQKDKLIVLSFKDFMITIRKAYLPANWEETVHCELGGMSQGHVAFWGFAMHVQSQNSLLHRTPSYLTEEKLQH